MSTQNFPTASHCFLKKESLIRKSIVTSAEAMKGQLDNPKRKELRMFVNARILGANKTTAMNSD